MILSLALVESWVEKTSSEKTLLWQCFSEECCGVWRVLRGFSDDAQPNIAQERWWGWGLKELDQVHLACRTQYGISRNSENSRTPKNFQNVEGDKKYKVAILMRSGCRCDMDAAWMWSGCGLWVSYLIFLNPLLFKNIAHVGFFKYFVFIFVMPYPCVSIYSVFF